MNSEGQDFQKGHCMHGTVLGPVAKVVHAPWFRPGQGPSTQSNPDIFAAVVCTRSSRAIGHCCSVDGRPLPKGAE